ncbi:hypothetical protein ACFVUY_09225 [Kitasatospora sp. NPDC058063]|uniref:hypothetical protein n=1 Tax=unclassified Kitasatospora TaxID=2633591 RepID=UPI0036D8DC9A
MREAAGAGQRAPALRLSGLRKRFGSVVAVDGVELPVPRGSFHRLTSGQQRSAPGRMRGRVRGRARARLPGRTTAIMNDPHHRTRPEDS